MEREQFDFDLLVIGGGSGGVRAARWATRYGAKVALVEKDRLGGTCVIRGCVPKKFMSYAANFSSDVKVMRDYGWQIELGKFDWEYFFNQRNKEINRLSSLYQQMLENNGVTLFSGAGVLYDEHTVIVRGKHISAKYILIATGSKPMIPGFPGVEHTITSNQFLSLKQQPQHVLVAGGGYIAVEFAGILNGLGSEVEIVIRRDKILRGFDYGVREFLQKEMANQGIQFLTETTIQKIEKSSTGLKVYFSNGQQKTYDHVLLAQGRKPAIEELQLERLGIGIVQDKIAVDEYFKTSVDSIYAIGDCVNDFNLTPVALNEGMIVADNLFANKEKRVMDYYAIPTAVFSSPQIGTVGMSEDEALEQGVEIDVYESSFRPLKYSLSSYQQRAFMKLIVDRHSGVVLGVHIVSGDAAEMIQGVGVAVKARLTKAQFDACVGVHPTSAEEFVTMREARRL